MTDATQPNEEERLRLILSLGKDSPLRAELLESIVQKMMTDDEYRERVIRNAKDILGADYE